MSVSKPIVNTCAPGGLGLANSKQRIEAGITEREARLRKQFPEVRGKVVDWIDLWEEEGALFFSLQFQDKTNFAASYTPSFIARTCEFSDRKTGNVVILQDYMRRRR